MAKKLSVTSAGKAVWPHLHSPDTKFDENGIYSVKLEQDTDAGAPLKDQIDTAMKESLAAAIEAEEDAKKKKKIKMADAPYAEDDDAETVTFNFKMTASGVSRKDKKPFTQKPGLFDAKLKPLPDGTKIGGGSTIKISYEIVPFYTALVGAGVTLRLKAVQVLNLVEYSRDGAGYGFGEEEGFTGTDEATETGFDTDGEDNDADTDADVPEPKEQKKSSKKTGTSGKKGDDF